MAGILRFEVPEVEGREVPALASTLHMVPVPCDHMVPRGRTSQDGIDIDRNCRPNSVIDLWSHVINDSGRHRTSSIVAGLDPRFETLKKSMLWPKTYTHLCISSICMSSVKSMYACTYVEYLTLYTWHNIYHI